jgi:hypothetical protein
MYQTEVGTYTMAPQVAVQYPPQMYVAPQQQGQGHVSMYGAPPAMQQQQPSYGQLKPEMVVGNTRSTPLTDSVSLESGQMQNGGGSGVVYK